MAGPTHISGPDFDKWAPLRGPTGFLVRRAQEELDCRLNVGGQNSTHAPRWATHVQLNRLFKIKKRVGPQKITLAHTYPDCWGLCEVTQTLIGPLVWVAQAQEQAAYSALPHSHSQLPRADGCQLARSNQQITRPSQLLIFGEAKMRENFGPDCYPPNGYPLAKPSRQRTRPASGCPSNRPSPLATGSYTNKRFYPTIFTFYNKKSLV